MSPRRSTARPAVAALVVVAGLALPTAAHAAFDVPRLVSGNATLESDVARQPAVSGDGRYVVFTGSVAGVSGVYRRDLVTGALDLVAGGDAATPSVSGDGRYVAFTTTAALDPANDSGDGCRDVYVRDLSRPADAADAFALASARDGGATGLSYDAGTGGTCTSGGSAAAGRVALSADGRRVAFTVLGASDLTAPAAGDPVTPAAQVALRDLDARSTTLVTQTRESLGAAPVPVADGGAFVPTVAGDDATIAERSSAAISADGTTVAWMGTDIAAQAPVVPGGMADTGQRLGRYLEPLWRRVADGPGAATRRIVGGDDPACGCVGPFDTLFDKEGNSNQGNGGVFGLGTWGLAPRLPGMVPALSADGRTVALLVEAATDEKKASLANVSYFSDEPPDVYVVDMSPGLTRRQATRPVTRWASTDFEDFSRSGQITDLAFSADARHLAFVTTRTAFPFSPPALITPSLGATAEIQQLYVADLGAGTLSLASIGYDGAPGNRGTLSPALSGDGARIAFTSGATNLVFGANSVGATGVFTLDERRVPAVPGVQSVTAPPGPAAVAVATRRLGLSTHRRADGRLTVDVTVPDAGRLTVTARGRVTVVKRRKRTVVTKSLTSAKATAKRPGRTTLRLTVAKAYRPLVRTKHGLDTTVGVTFTSAGKPTLRTDVAARFRVTLTAAQKKAAAKKAAAKKAAAKKRAAARKKTAAKKRRERLRRSATTKSAAILSTPGTTTDRSGSTR
ncbi:hypothetical protein AB0L40_00120 [Patulibacter sp. NPDC049589]|uniref:hypothetical protein n=1 Tax=Patulibacter sp. NPDC049589 TaxID=3154731 RepID=UPI0034477888